MDNGGHPQHKHGPEHNRSGLRQFRKESEEMTMELKSKLWYFDNFNLLSSLSHDEKMELSEKASMKSIPKGQMVFFTDDSSRSIYFLKSGKVKISRYSEGGRELIMRLLGPGEIFGELSLTGQTDRDEIAEVVEDAVICDIDLSNLENMMMRNPLFNLQVTKWIGLTLRKVQTRLESLCFKSSTERIKAFLKDMADQHGRQLRPGDDIEVRLNLTHEDIAKLTVTTRQNVTTVLSELEKRGVISYDRKRILIKRMRDLQ